MNCKPGDLAVVVRAQKDPSWLGRVVTVVHRYPLSIELAWVCDPMPEGFDGIRDVALRPIRDSDGEDETLTWAGKPADVVAHVPIVRPALIEPLPHFVGGGTPTGTGGEAYSLGGRTA